jgi:hypothetical protein
VESSYELGNELSGSIKCNVSPVKYELGFYNPEDDILHSHRRENLKSYKEKECLKILKKSSGK